MADIELIRGFLSGIASLCTERAVYQGYCFSFEELDITADPADALLHRYSMYPMPEHCNWHITANDITHTWEAAVSECGHKWFVEAIADPYSNDRNLDSTSSQRAAIDKTPTEDGRTAKALVRLIATVLGDELHHVYRMVTTPASGRDEKPHIAAAWDHFIFRCGSTSFLLSFEVDD